MSKPNLIQFGTSVGFFGNQRVRDLRELLAKTIKRKVDFCELAPMLFQMVMSAAAENRIDGDFNIYGPNRWADIFVRNFAPVEPQEVMTIIKLMHEVGLLENNKIRSWAKFNKHLAEYEGIKKSRAKAAKAMHKKREQEAKAALKNGSHLPPESEEKPAKNGSQNPSPSKQLWLIEKALESATGKRKKELQQQKRELLSQATGVDLSETPPAPPAPAPKPPKIDRAAAEWSYLVAAREMLQDSPDLLSAGMVKALLKAGDKLPERVAQKFSRLVGELGGTRNPVPE